MKEFLFITGLSPLIIFSVIFMIKKKAYFYPVISLVVSCAIIASGFFVWKTPKESVSAASAEHLNYMANTNMLSGNLDEAKTYLDKLFSNYGDTIDGLIASVRFSILKNDEQQSILSSLSLLAFIEKNGGSLPGDIRDFVASISDGTYTSSDALTADKALYESLETSLADSDLTPADYGVESVSDADITDAVYAEEKLSEDVLEYIESEVNAYVSDDDSAANLDAAISASNTLIAAYDEYTASGASDSYEIIEKMTQTLNSLYKKDSSIFDLSEIRDAYITGLIALEKYDTLINYAIASGDDTALAMTASLYISGIITESDFPSDFADSSDYLDVLNKCSKIYKSLDKDDYSNSELSEIKAMLQTAVAKNSNPVLAEIEDMLSPETAAKEDMAALYIQDSCINSELYDKTAAFSSLESALDAVNSSDNDALKGVLEEISSIIDNSASDDDITNLDSYLSRAYDESLPADSDLISVPDSFLNMSNSYVNEKRAMINIGIVKTDNFPTVKAYVSSSGTDLTDKENIVLTDCGIVITDYTIEKAQYSKAEIFLVCDNSGSMGSDIDALKDAVSEFVRSKNSKELIGIITFDSSVLSDTGLLTDESELLSAIDGFHAGGGTYIRSGIEAAFEGFSSSDDSFNVIIVMTDGQDSSYSSENSLSELRQLCIENNTVMYTIGLGDVSAAYLQDIADAGMGSFIYSSSSVQLEDLYSFIHNQLDNNYVITYTAKDTTTVSDRLLTIENTADGYSGSRYYSLDYTSDSDDENSYDDTNPLGITVSRLGISSVIKGASNDAEFTILGSGFENAESISVSISGNKIYSNLSTTVANDKKLTVTIPAAASYGTYDVSINIDGYSWSLSELSIIENGSATSITFGDYTFSAMSITTADNTITLKGNVIMNNYLHFNGDVTLSGSLSGNILALSESAGSYITYGNELPGLLGQFFDNTISLPAITNLTLYKDGEIFDKYYALGVCYYAALEIPNPYIELHPEYIKMTLSNVTFDFPVLNNLLEYADSPITAGSEEQAIVISTDTVGIVCSLSSDLNLSGRSALHLGPATLSVSGVELSLDTINHDYAVGLSVNIDGVTILSDNDGVDFGFNIEIAGGLLDSINLAADIDFTVVKAPPVTISDFNAGVEGLASETQNSTLSSRLLSATWYGQCDVSFFKLNELIPGLSTFLGDILDISVLSLDDTKLGIKLSSWNVSLDTTAKLFETVTLGNIEVDIGNYTYSNYILGIDESNAAGIHAAVSNDLNLDFSNNFNFGISGSSQIDINSYFSGVMSTGAVNYNVKIFGRHTGDLDGVFLAGLHNNNSQFTILVKGTDLTSGDSCGFRFTLTNGNIIPGFELY